MYVEKLSLKNFRGIRDLDIEFDKRLNVLVGDNGCGKTTILDAVTRGIKGSRLNHVAGTNSQIVKDHLVIQPIDISNSTDHATYNLIFNCQTKSISVTGSSNPNKIKSTLKKHFSRMDSVALTSFFADRGIVITDLPQGFFQKTGLLSLPPELEMLVNKNPFYFYALSWMKEQEDLENAEFRSFIDGGELPINFRANSKLQAVKQAVAKITGLSKISFNNNKNMFEVVKSVGEGSTKLMLGQLSLGEQVFVGLVAAIACRIILSADDFDLLDAEHIVIIDEIDLHLHPKWQRKIVPALLDTFPNCQFIITTHSPQILSEVHAKNIIVLYRDKSGNIQYRNPKFGRGLSSSGVVTAVMGGSSLNEDLDSRLKQIYAHIERDEFAEARILIEGGEADFGRVPVLIEARTTLEFSE